MAAAGSPYESLLSVSQNTPGQHLANHTYEMTTKSPELVSSEPLIPHTVPVQKSRHFDWPNLILILSIWVLLAISCLVLLAAASIIPDNFSEVFHESNKSWASPAIGFAVTIGSIAATLNQTLVDRCWRRVTCAALEFRASKLNDAQMAHNLRAANFEWLNFLIRLCKLKVTFSDVRAALSYSILKLGTLASFSSVSFCVVWDSPDQPRPTPRWYWVVIPILIHGGCLVVGLAIWLLPPKELFSTRYDDVGLLQRYLPYLERVRSGSLANHETVARYLLSEHNEPLSSLNVEIMPGTQFKPKLAGIWIGLLLMNVPTIAVLIALHSGNHDDLASRPYLVSGIQYSFLAQHFFYSLAADFVVWNLSLEGLCKTDGISPKRHINHLGYGSGIMLLVRAIKQRRPLRAFIFLWLFWLQTTLHRVYTFTFSVFAGFNLFTNDVNFPIEDINPLYGNAFWIVWIIMTILLVWPLFLAWSFTSFQAPICPPSGWIWAQIAKGAMYTPGAWGVRDGKAAWGDDVIPFRNCRGQSLG